ncbi:MAG: hypothetical protein ACE5F5_12435 [Acidimicrobiia bacterium]
MRHHWARATAGLLLVLAPVMGGPQALAQEPGDSSMHYSITPSRLEVRVGPGESFQFAIQVVNHSDQPLSLITYVDDVDIPANDLLEPDELAFTASRWARFTAETLQVAPLSTAEGIIIVEIPEDTPAGGYHAIAYFQAVGPEVEQGVVAVGRLGATLLLEVAPSGTNLRREALVSETTLDVQWDGLFSPRVEGRTTIDNIGDLHLTVGGLDQYRFWPGSGSHEEKIGPATVLRGTRHSFISTIDDVPLFGKVSLTSELVYQVGPNDLPVILTQASVWVIPWALIAFVALLVGATVGHRVLRRRRRQKAASLPSADTQTDPVKAEV